MERGFKIERRTRMHDGIWGDWRLEAECRHFADAMLIWDRRYKRRQESDDTGAQVQAEYRMSANATGEALRFLIIGV